MTACASQGRDRPLRKLVGQAPCELSRLRQSRARQKHGELVSAKAACHVGRACPSNYPLGKALQGVVATQVTDLVVHLPEVVDVEQNQRKSPAIAVCASHFKLKTLREETAASKASQRIP
jgi:hypothetical protein